MESAWRTVLMKPRFALVFGLVAGFGLLAQFGNLHAQPAALNRVLELDGNGSYVQLPSNIFDDLSEATIELWVKWDRFGPGDAMAFCFGDRSQAMFLGNHLTYPRLKFTLYDRDQVRHP